MKPTVLLIEDDDAIAELVSLHLREAGFDVLRESDGRAAIRTVSAKRFDAVILDLMLPGADGLDVCRHIRAMPVYLPLIIISARTAETHRIVGLEVGADDYLAKPFSVLELIARVRALLRRADKLRNAPAQGLEVRFGRYVLDPDKRELRDGDAVIALTLREFDLLYFLARHPNQIFSRSDLLSRVWGAGFDGFEHTVNSHINRLRSKIESDPRDPRVIETVWGMGYRLRADGTKS